MSELRKRMIRAALEAGAANRKPPTPHACQAALDALDAAEAEIERLRAALGAATDVARQAVEVINLVQTYKQPDDPWDENALTMHEHEVFDFDVEAARAALIDKEAGG